MNLCIKEVCLIGFIQVCNLRNCLQNNCNWQGTKVKISLSASKSTRYDLRRIVKLWKNLKWIVWFTLMGNAMFSSVYFAGFSSGMDLSSLLKTKSTRRENHSGMGHKSNKRKVKHEQSFCKYSWTLTGMVFSFQEPLLSKAGETKRLGFMNMRSICMLFWDNELRETGNEECRSDNHFTPKILPISIAMEWDLALIWPFERK